MQEVQERPNVHEEMRDPSFYPGKQWRWGFTPSAEIWNGRLAMIGFFMTLLIEVLTKNGFLGGLIPDWFS